MSGAGGGGGDARDRILARVRDAVARREPVEHPGDFGGWRPDAAESDTVARFAARFTAQGGSVVRCATDEEARAALAERMEGAVGVAVGAGIPEALRGQAPTADAAHAGVAVSMARGAVAETGSLVLDARDGRRTQLLAPVHLIVVRAEDVHLTMADAFAAMKDDLPSALGLHSGPSKSADLGKVLVTGVHGPGRVVAVVMG